MLLCLGGKGVNNAVNAVDCAAGVERAQEIVACLRCRHGGADGLQIPHFAQLDHIGCLAEAGAECGEVILRVHGDLTLADDAQLVAVEVLNGVFQCDNVAGAGVVDAIHNAGKGGGFAAACRACHQHHARGIVGKGDDLGGDVQCAVIGDGEGHHADDGGHAATLTVGVDAEAGKTCHGEGEIVIPRL